MGDGADKYGAGKWLTSNQVTKLSIMDALERHWIEYKKGYTHCDDAPHVHHLGAVIANCAILLERFED